MIRVSGFESLLRHRRNAASAVGRGRSEPKARWPGMLLSAWNRRHSLLWKICYGGPGGAADSTPARLSRTETEYERLRAEASALNARHGWATDDEFEAVLPTFASREEVRALNEQLSPPGSATPAPQPAELVRLLLLDLAGWATGIRLAGQAFGAAPPEG
jgi:hypothetical protein